MYFLFLYLSDKTDVSECITDAAALHTTQKKQVSLRRDPLYDVDKEIFFWKLGNELSM